MASFSVPMNYNELFYKKKKKKLLHIHTTLKVPHQVMIAFTEKLYQLKESWMPTTKGTSSEGQSVLKR